MKNRRQPQTSGFTLVELLVVITIIVLVSAVTLPVVLPALNHRQVTEGARILQAALVGARDAAIRANDPRGVRLLPDPVLTVPSLGTAGGTLQAGVNMLSYNRIVPIEPAPDYNEGTVNVSPPQTIVAATGFPPAYPTDISGSTPYPYSYGVGVTSYVLMIEECPFYQNDPVQGLNSPTSWFWNIRVGDKIRLSDSGRYYTVVGPLTINPQSTSYSGQNPELFVNVGPPGTTSPLSRNYGTVTSNPEFLFVVNGQDDNQDGYVDNGWDGIDQNYNGIPDDPLEWEVEKWIGPLASQGFVNQSYTIVRRPVPTQGAREVTLPPGIVIDATSWQSTKERSRLPIDALTLYADIMLNPNGQAVPTLEYSGTSSFNPGAPFYHFWVAEREDVHAMTDLWGSTLTNPNTGSSFLLPLPQQYYTSSPPGYSAPALTTIPPIYLRGERRLLTLFTRSGLITSSSIETFQALNTNGGVDWPFLYTQSGGRESE